MRVIGTAGHVDHGKSTLVQAITGIHPDRLKEEQEREMTIDLGFAWFELPDGEEVGIIDVPGHRDFIENMLAGIGGIDAVIFVIAADEGVMPQTREHLAILDLLEVKSGVIALTKVDLVPDEDWLELVESDIQDTLSGTILEEAPIIRVSGKTGAGVVNLLSAIRNVLEIHPPRPDLGRPRLPIDRVFTISGFGTVVTGTLTDGVFRVGDDIEVLPLGLRGRIRGLQTHKKKESLAIPGSRTAVNISGINFEAIDRGEVVVHPGTYQPTGRFDTRFRLLSDASKALLHNTEAKLFIGAAEVVVRIRLLGSEELLPGEAGWLQLESKQPIIAVRGDRFILRRLSPGETLGGGYIVDPHPSRRHKRFGKKTLERLEALAEGTPADILLQAALTAGITTLDNLIETANLKQETAIHAATELISDGKLLVIDPGQASTQHPQLNSLLSSADYWQQLHQQSIHTIQNYHTTQHLRSGMPREELKSKLQLNGKIFNALIGKLVREGELIENGPLLARPDHRIQFNQQQKQSIRLLMHEFHTNPYSPPSVKESIQKVGEQVFQALVELGKLVQVSGDVVFDEDAYNHMVAEIEKALQIQKTLSAAQVRDRFKTSRKYILALLEHMDAIGKTVREGDVRRLK